MIYRINGREVTREEFLAGVRVPKRRRLAKQNGKRFKAPGCFGDTGNWTGENVGRGRYCPQLARYQKDPQAYVHSRRDLIKRGKERGYAVED